MTTPIHQSVQTGKPWPIWIGIATSAFVGWAAFIDHFILNRPWGSSPPSAVVMVIVWLLLAFVVPIFLMTLRLTISVLPDSVHIRFRPIWTARIDLADVATAEPVTYHPILEWGGWGIRWRPGGNWAYILSGNRGVKVTLHNGKFRLLGSSDPDALAQAILEQVEANDPHPEVSV